LPVSFKTSEELPMRAELTEGELQLVDFLRRRAAPDFRIVIEKTAGAWKISMSVSADDEVSGALGAGATFDDAWYRTNLARA
jgi:hypothetical protein